MPRVKKVFDGDSFQLVSGKGVRLAGVRAPEKGQRNFSKAKEILKGLVEGENVSIEKVGKSYGRDVAKVKVDGKSVNRSMQSRGYTDKGK